jgi:hypothetical protein
VAEVIKHIGKLRHHETEISTRTVFPKLLEGDAFFAVVVNFLVGAR